MGELSTIVGFIAGLVTTAANLPQVWKTYRSKSAEGLSFRMLLALAIGLGDTSTRHRSRRITYT
jgi:MtN3 and saliva related transmembrane protein